MRRRLMQRLRTSLLAIVFSLCLLSFSGARPKSPPPETVPSPQPFSDLSFGWSSWGLSGSDKKFRNYASPPQNLYLGLSTILFPPDGGQTGNLWALGAAEHDFSYGGGATFLYGRLTGRLTVQRNRFFSPTPVLIPLSQRVTRRASVRYLISPDFALSYSYSMDLEDHFFEPPKDSLNQWTRYWDIGAEGKAGPGQLTLAYQHRHYSDRTVVRPNVTVRGWRIAYLLEGGQNLGVEASLARFAITQRGRPDNDVTSLALFGDWIIGSDTDFSVLLRRDSIDLPFIANASVRERRFLSASVRHHLYGWNLLLRATQREAERIRGDRSFVDVPRWRTWEGRLSGRLGRDFRLTLRGSAQHLSHFPVMTARDPRPLFYDGRRSFQARLEGGSPLLSGYFSWALDQYDNDARLLQMRARTLAFGVQYQLSPKASLFGEYAYENWTARSEMAEFPTLDSFLSNSRLTSVGLQWSIDRKTSLSLGISDFATANDNPLLLRNLNTSGSFVTASLTYRFPAGYRVSLIIAPWRYRDRIAGVMNYDTSLVLLTGSAQF
ncbi:MAG: hypothetical protein NZ959_03615 [Armatimonadetes bacterium]|nr:hypothetical protein [Armatimonadota bacterium]MDW8121730.1 hypothetical protein [Armatimonadota bacterium]